MSSNIRQLDARSFESVVTGSQRPVLVDFHAEWCPPCQALAPIIEGLASDFSDRAVVAAVDVDAEPALAARFEVRSIPTVILFSGGEPVRRFVGLKSRDEFAGALDDAIGKAAA